MVNKAELKKRMIDCSVRTVDIAKSWGVTNGQVYNKLNGVSSVTLEEAEKLQELLEIPDEQFAFYFLAHGRVS